MNGRDHQLLDKAEKYVAWVRIPDDDDGSKQLPTELENYGPLLKAFKSVYAAGWNDGRDE